MDETSSQNASGENVPAPESPDGIRDTSATLPSAYAQKVGVHGKSLVPVLNDKEVIGYRIIDTEILSAVLNVSMQGMH